jgi:FAD/FMN-containing dehydrogenase
MTNSHSFPLPVGPPTHAADVVPATATAPALIWPGSAAYDAARRAWNLHSDQRPACICIARSVEHVQIAVAYARDNDLTIAAQSTGHLSQTLPSLEQTLLLRVALDDGEVDVDPIGRTARIKAGTRWGDVVPAVAPHGLAVMHGSSPSVGVVGYLLGGGLSFYGRKHGLAVNHVRAFEVVTPDGNVRRADAEHNRDLFYALRGGGGSYAIVTAVEIGLLPYAEVTGGALFFPLEKATRVLRAWTAWTARASDEITTTFRILRLPAAPEVPEPLRGIATVCVNGVALDPAQAAHLEAELRWAATPIMGGFVPMPSAAVVRLHADPEDPVPAIGDGMLLNKVDDWAIDVFVKIAGAADSPLVAAELRHLGGALAAPPSGAGARGHLEGRFLLFGVGIPGAPAPAAELDGFLNRYLAAMSPWATGTRFLSFAERTSSLSTCVPDGALTRLTRIRASYDPDRLLVASHVPAN